MLVGGVLVTGKHKVEVEAAFQSEMLVKCMYLHQNDVLVLVM